MPQQLTRIGLFADVTGIDQWVARTAGDDTYPAYDVLLRYARAQGDLVIAGAYLAETDQEVHYRAHLVRLGFTEVVNRPPRRRANGQVKKCALMEMVCAIATEVATQSVDRILLVSADAALAPMIKAVRAQRIAVDVIGPEEGMDPRLIAEASRFFGLSALGSLSGVAPTGRRAATARRPTANRAA